MLCLCVCVCVCACVPTCMTALNQQVLPTFFRPTGQLSILFLSCGLGESLHTSVWVRFRLALFSAMLASKTLKRVREAKHIQIHLKGTQHLSIAICFILKVWLESTAVKGLLALCTLYTVFFFFHYTVSFYCNKYSSKVFLWSEMSRYKLQHSWTKRGLSLWSTSVQWEWGLIKLPDSGIWVLCFNKVILYMILRVVL